MGSAKHAWVLNLDAELELAKPNYQPSAKMAEQLVRFRALAQGLVQPGDVVLPDAAAAPAPKQAAGMVGRAWCPTPRAIALMRAAGVVPEAHPAAAVLKAVNHRAFAHQLKLGLPNQCLVRTLAEVEDLGRRPPHAWLLKRPLSFAGRGHCRVFGALDEPGRRWATASLQDDVLLAEPLVRPNAEFSLHGYLWADGRCVLGRICAQDVSERGVYRGVRPALPSDLATHETAALTDAAQAAGVALAAAGYFGPYGIDAYRYTRLAGDGEGFCALSEINARYTMAFGTGFPEHPV